MISLLCEDLKEDAAALACEKEIAVIRAILHAGASAERQIDIMQRALDELFDPEMATPDDPERALRAGDRTAPVLGQLVHDGTTFWCREFTGTAWKLREFDPATGEVIETPLGPGSAPHGVIVGPDGAPWITDGGQNAIVRVDPGTREVSVFPLPAERRQSEYRRLRQCRGSVVHGTGGHLRSPRSRHWRDGSV